jgi:hypothetical protein
MKDLYTSPVVTVEELTKLDVLCASTETSQAGTSSNNPFDNANQSMNTLGDFSQFM